MKKISIIIGISLWATSIFAQKVQEKEVPAPVLSAFQKQYPQAKQAKWQKENQDYEVEFEQNEVEISILFDKQGNILETETEIPTNELPKSVLDYVATQYKDDKIKEAAKITDNKGKITYEVEIKKKELFFDQQGNFISVEK